MNKSLNLTPNQLMQLKLLEKDSIETGTHIQFLLFTALTKNKSVARLKEKDYEFFRTTYGPFSKQILDDIKLLIKKNLIRHSTKRLSLTKEAKTVLKKEWDEIPVIEKNIYDAMLSIIKKTTQKLKAQQDYDNFTLNLRKTVFENRVWQHTEIGHEFQF